MSGSPWRVSGGRVCRGQFPGAAATACRREPRGTCAVPHQFESGGGSNSASSAGIGSLEDAHPLVEVGATNRVGVPRRLGVPRLDTPPEFVGRHVEVVQFDTDTKAASRGAHLVAFRPRPEPEIEDDAQAETEDVLGETPEFVVDLRPGRRVPRAGAEGDEPLVLREAQGAPVRSQPPREGGLPCCGQPAREKQSGVAHSDPHSHHAARRRTRRGDRSRFGDEYGCTVEFGSVEGGTWAERRIRPSEQSRSPR